MSGFIREMMPDNIPELMLTSGLSFGCYLIFSYYTDKNEDLVLANKELKQKINEQEKNFLNRIKQLNEEHKRYCETNTISEKTKNFLRSFG